MVRSGRRSVPAGAVAVLLAAGVLAGCRADAEVAEILATDQPDAFDVIVDTCNADLDVSVDESATEVVIVVRNNDRTLFPTGGDDCQDAVRVELDAPLGDRAIRLADGRDITITTFAADPDATG
jgi:hypothetical protein